METLTANDSTPRVATLSMLDRSVLLVRCGIGGSLLPIPIHLIKQRVAHQVCKRRATHFSKAIPRHFAVRSGTPNVSATRLCQLVTREAPRSSFASNRQTSSLAKVSRCEEGQVRHIGTLTSDSSEHHFFEIGAEWTSIDFGLQSIYWTCTR
jgi:hypothetical protein